MKRGELYRVDRPGGDPKQYLAQFVGSLAKARLTELDRALKMALDLT